MKEEKMSIRTAVHCITHCRRKERKRETEKKREEREWSSIFFFFILSSDIDVLSFIRFSSKVIRYSDVQENNCWFWLSNQQLVGKSKCISTPTPTQTFSLFSIWHVHIKSKKANIFSFYYIYEKWTVYDYIIN